MIVSSIFKIIGVVLVGGIFFTQVLEISFVGAILSMIGGALISAAYMSCFAALLYHNDSPLVQIVWNTTSPVVVILGYFFLGEEFSSKAYIGMGIVFLGAFAVSFSKDAFNCKLTKFILLLIPMIAMYSCSEVLMKYVEQGNVDFQQSFPFVCLGQVSFGLVLLAIRRNPKQIGEIIKNNQLLFFVSEAVELLGLFLMQLGITKAPSIALFGVVEAFMPVAVIMLTCISIFFLKIFKRGDVLEKVYEENMLSGLSIKIIATAIMMIGVYLI
jgi:drug/metabolite transporter (DMT)-like permease